MVLGKKNIAKIENTVKEIENTLCAEIVPAILSRSDEYPASHLRLGVLISLLISLPVAFYFSTYLPYSLLLGFSFGYLFSRLFGPFNFLIKRDEVYTETIQMAYAIFLENRIHLTKKRIGVLVFYSILEKRIIVLCDESVKNKVSNEVWRELIRENIGKLKKINLTDAYCQLLNKVGNTLERDFAGTSDENRLSNKLISDLA